MRRLSIFTTIIVMLMVIACSGNTNIGERLYSADIEAKVKDSNKLSEEQKTLFHDAISFSKTSEGTSLEGKTVTVIIDGEKARKQTIADEEKRKKEEERLRQEEEKLKETKKQEALNKSVVVVFTKKTDVPKNTDAWRFSDEIHFTFDFKNTTDKDIHGFQGVATFKDIFGNTIKSFNLSYDEGVKANSTTSWVGVREVNQFMDEDVKLYGTDIKDIVFDFEFNQVIFADGEKLAL